MDIQRAKVIVQTMRKRGINGKLLTELYNIIDPPASQPVELLPREHRIRQEPGFAMIAPTDWIETTERWHARCETHRRAMEYRQQIESALDAVHQHMLARDCIEWIEHQTEPHIVDVIGNALEFRRMTNEPADEYCSRLVTHVRVMYA